MDWIQKVLDATEEAESPRSYVYWSAIATLSAIVNNKCYIQKGGIYKLYPNLYVLLVGPSGLKKSFPPMVSERIASEINNTRVITGRSSIQAIVTELSRSKSIPGGTIIKESIGFINNGELSTSLVRDEDSLTILTTLYDGMYIKEWTNMLKSTGKEELKKPCITLLGALNQTHFDSMISEKEITGGFIARCVIVVEAKRHKKNPLIDDVPFEVDYPALAEMIRPITLLSGRVKIDDLAKKLFKDWYQDWEPEEMNDKTGTVFRVHDTVLKVAMLIALGREQSMIIGRQHMQEAFDVTMRAMHGSASMTTSQGIDKSLSSKLKLVIHDLLHSEAFTITRQKLLSNHPGDFDKFDLDKIVDTLFEAGGLTYKTTGKDTFYTLTEKAVKSFQGRRERK